MGIEDLTRAGVQAAVQEHDLLGPADFRAQYGQDAESGHWLILDGRHYDARATATLGHQYSSGAAAGTGTFHGDENTLVRQLRALGFTVEESAPATEPPGTSEAPQLVLQPRGTRDGGPQNFAKSVRRGVRVSELRKAIGPGADVLDGLYPDGIARLWGSTPTTQSNNEKARALRDRRVGDDILFYTGNSFIARARVLRLINSQEIAQEVWGADESGATWEHIMALGDVEEFAEPVPAADVLDELSVPRPLRSLTVRSAQDYARVAGLLPPGQNPRPAYGSPPGHRRDRAIGRAEVLGRITALRTRHDLTGTPSRHEALAVLWVIGRIAASEPRLAPWSLFRDEVGALLAEFGLPESPVTPEYAFWHLRGSGLWEIHGIPENLTSMPQPGDFNTAQPVAGLPFEVARILQEPETRLRALVELRSKYLPDIDLQALLGRLGLSGYLTAEGLDEEPVSKPGRKSREAKRATGPAGRRTSTSSSVVRDAALAAAVKEIHDHRCQVCGTRLAYKRNPYSEAAHIRGLGTPHDGPDELHNLLCLCPNHHVLFDGLEIYVDGDDIVQETRGGKSLGRLRRHPDHPIDEKYLQYHRTLCEFNS
ncbi:HNH endonuclease [Kitasatospora purpeofusca]|uniref:HNH endonuclease n=1 Tax=Kitasatospora purpeofusca TaxID=67352 RepID=UPI0036D24215